MEPAPPLALGPFHVDGRKGRVWRGATSDKAPYVNLRRVDFAGLAALDTPQTAEMLSAAAPVVRGARNGAW